MVALRLFGSAQVLGPDGTSIDALVRQTKRMALLAYLAAATPRGLHRRDKLLAIFWPELDEPHARNALSQALHVLRGSLGEGAIVARGESEVGVDAGVVRCDVVAFEAALAAGKPEAALELYRGDLLDGFFVSGLVEFERWVEGERVRLRQRVYEAAWAVADSSARLGNSPQAVTRARWASALQPLDDVSTRRLMLFLDALGDRSGAIQAYQSFRRALAEELALEPAAETRALAERIARAESKDGPSSVATGQDPAAAPTAPLEPPAAPSAPRIRSRWRTRSLALSMVGASAVLAAAVTMTSTQLLSEPRQPRIVVLPFQNLGPPQSGYFAEGVRDEIAGRLALSGSAHVLAGNAARRYADASDTARASPDDFFLDGTASWQPRDSGGGAFLRVRLTLTHPRDSTTLWGAVFEKEIAQSRELFELYESVAQRVVNELNVALSAPYNGKRATIPTTSLDAYSSYLRGRDYLRRTSTPVNFRAAIASLEQAVALDPKFPQALAWLIHANTDAEWLAGMGQQHLDRAAELARRALALAPGDPDVNNKLAHYYYVCCEDYERAMWHLTASNAARPADAQTVMFMGNINKRQGKWDAAIEQYQRAIRLDPTFRWPQLNLAHAQMWRRRYDDAERTFQRVLETEPQDIFAHAHLAWIAVLRHGNTARARRIVANAAASSDGYTEMRIPFYLELIDRKYDSALALLRAPAPGLTGSLLNEPLVSDAIRRALVLRLKGDSAAARRQFDTARAELETAMPAASGRRAKLLFHSGLAIAYAGLGRADDARAHAGDVIAGAPLTVDAIEGPKYLLHVAIARAMLGEADAAIDLLEQLLAVGAPVTRASIGAEPFWETLRGQPRFQRLVGRR